MRWGGAAGRGGGRRGRARRSPRSQPGGRGTPRARLAAPSGWGRARPWSPRPARLGLGRGPVAPRPLLAPRAAPPCDPGREAAALRRREKVSKRGLWEARREGSLPGPPLPRSLSAPLPGGRMSRVGWSWREGALRPLSLPWPAWTPPDPGDFQSEARAAKNRPGGLIERRGQQPRCCKPLSMWRWFEDCAEKM